MADEIRCDLNGCDKRLVHTGELTQASSVDFATARGWQAWLGTLRSYHYCPAHFAAYGPSVTAAAPERLARGTEPPEARERSEANLGAPRAMPNPHTSDCRNASCASQFVDEPTWTGGEK